MTTKEIVKKHNDKLMFRLIPDKTKLIFGRGIIDPNDEIFNQPLKKISIFAQRLRFDN